MSPDDIYKNMREVLEEALGVDEEEVTPEAKDLTLMKTSPRTR